MSYVLKCKSPKCGKKFPVAARKTVRPPRKQYPAPDETTLIEYACCPHCLGIDLERVKE